MSSPKVIAKQIARPVEYDPEIRVEFEGSGCAVTELSWGNPGVMPALRTLFACQKNESVIAIVVTRHGIKAEIGRRG